ncbi:MAG: ThiF family adenylyltransferase [Acidobacteriia bacterium]|nr:ThiF family adenylyltransferase [Terriglobia bacterium]
MSANDPQQQQMIREAMKAIAERRPGRSKLVYDKAKRTIVAVTEGTQTPRALNITADDADMFAVVTLSSRWFREQWPQFTRQGRVSVLFSSWDSGDAFTQCDLGPLSAPSVAEGVVSLGEGTAAQEKAQLRIVLTPAGASTPDPSIFIAPDGSIHRATARQQVNGAEQSVAVVFVDVQPTLANRRVGILETTMVSDKSVLCVGLGTGGAHAAIELAKCGVGRFILIDPDRLSVGNVVRHPGGISQVGRLKVNVVRDLIHEKNPDVKVSVHPVAVTFENLEAIRPLISQANVVICGTDSRPSKLLVNRLCIEDNVVAVYGGAFRRAYGGQVLRVRPKKSPCHECFVAAMPEESTDVEISSASAAEEVAYSDRPVAIEPGLSVDVLPIANMLTKLALLELLADKPTSLSILKADFAAPWYLWLNRPEPGTQYADWPPLSDSSDEMTINRWYGIDLARDPDCPVCGKFIPTLAASYGLDLASPRTIPSLPTKE